MPDKLFTTWLPFPPSVNSAFGGGSGQRRFKSRQYKDWERQAMLMCDKIKTITEPVRIAYTFFMPDKRPRDLSNYIKCTEDLLVSRGVILDDSTAHVQEINLYYGGMDRQNARVEVEIFSA